MNLNVPFNVEVRAKASSSYDDATIERRLAVLAERDDDDARREETYLRELIERRRA